LTVPAVAGAATDNERWNQGQAEMQKNLPPGMSADAYRKKLEELGYKITSTNYNNPDYLEYEVVKGDQTWEVQIDVDNDTHKATKVDVAMNMWKTDATKQEMERNEALVKNASPSAESHRTATMRNNQYSDRDRSTTDQMVKELEGLPINHDKEFYKDTLRKRGYDISRVDKDDKDELQLEAVKNGHSVKMDIDFDEESGRSTKIDASNLWAESESTTRTREGKMGTTTSSMSDVGHRSHTESYSNR
jgi:hypothetical protein